jgi:hypothetical protein
MTRSPADFVEDKLGPKETCVAAKLVGERLAELVPPGALVYVAGSEPQILCYAHRFSPTRFDIAYPFTVLSPVAKTYQLEAIRDIQEHPPSAIVLIRDTTSWLMQPASPTDFLDFLKKLLAEKYNIFGGYLEEDAPQRWLEPLPKEDASHCTLILFKRKTS